MTVSTATAGATTSRLAGLDLVRGLTVAFMILVNNPGTWSAIYPPLQHAAWHGCSPTDLVFPFFMFITGASMPWSLSKGRAQGRSESELAWSQARRCLFVFLVGLALNGFPKYDLDTLRIPGVLQRIALASLLAGWFVRRGNARTWAFAALALLVVHTSILVGIAPPGSSGDLLAKGGDIGATVDRWLFGPQHLWSGGRGVYDPEGLLGTLSSAATVLLGAIGGSLILRHGVTQRMLLRLVIAGVLLTSVGLASDALLPINKALWTASYVAMTGGLALIALVGCLFIADVMNVRGGIVRVGTAFGRNPLFLFALAGVVGRSLSLIRVEDRTGKALTVKEFVFQHVFVPMGALPFASFAYALTLVMVFAVIAIVMDRRGIHLRF